MEELLFVEESSEMTPEAWAALDKYLEASRMRHELKTIKRYKDDCPDNHGGDCGLCGAVVEDPEGEYVKYEDAKDERYATALEVLTDYLCQDISECSLDNYKLWVIQRLNAKQQPGEPEKGGEAQKSCKQCKWYDNRHQEIGVGSDYACVGCRTDKFEPRDE